MKGKLTEAFNNYQSMKQTAMQEHSIDTHIPTSVGVTITWGDSQGTQWCPKTKDKTRERRGGGGGGGEVERQGSICSASQRCKMPSHALPYSSLPFRCLPSICAYAPVPPSSLPFSFT